MAGAVGAIVGESVGEIVMERRTQAALQETLEQAQILHDMGQILSQEEFDGLFIERLHMHQNGLSPAEIGQLVASGTALVGHLDVADAHSAAQTVTENNLSVWGGVKVAGKIAGRTVFNPVVGGAWTLYDLSRLAYKYYQSRCTGDEVAQAEVVKEAKTDATVMTVLTVASKAVPKAVEVGAKAMKKAGQTVCCAFDDFMNFLVAETTTLRPAFAGEARFASGEASALFREVQESSASFERKLAEHAKKGGSGAARKAMDASETLVQSAQPTVANSISNAANKAPYNARAMESLLQKNNPGATVTSSTLPPASGPNVRVAGNALEKEIKLPSGGTKTISVPFDDRGLPIFDKHAVVETRISGDLSSMAGDAHKRMATRQLREDIKAGRVSKNLFTEEQLKQINAGSKAIDGFTWHHDGSVQGRMQLVPREIHERVKHQGGNTMWGGGE